MLRSRQIIRCKAKAILRRPQIKKKTASNERRTYMYTCGNIIQFDKVRSGAPYVRFGKLFLIRDANKFKQRIFYVTFSLPLPNVTWHSGTWPYTMTPSVDQILHQFASLLPNLTLLSILTLLPNFGGFNRTLQRVRLANRGRLLLLTPGLVPFGTCICSNVETILSWTCHVCGPFEFRTSLGSSILLCWQIHTVYIKMDHITIFKIDSILKHSATI